MHDLKVQSFINSQSWLLLRGQAEEEAAQRWQTQGLAAWRALSMRGAGEVCRELSKALHAAVMSCYTWNWSLVNISANWIEKYQILVNVTNIHH